MLFFKWKGQAIGGAMKQARKAKGNEGSSKLQASSILGIIRAEERQSVWNG